MFNPIKMFQLLLISMLFVQLPNFAEAKSAGKSKVSAANVKLKFDKKVYYKLSHKNRLKYLQVFSDLAVQMEKAEKNKRKTADSDFYNDLQNLLFPRADAEETTVCLNGGVFFDKPASAASCSAVTDIPESHRFSNLAPYYTCGLATRCAAYFGVDSSGQGFCFDSASSATSQCDSKSTAANGRENLRDKLNNCSGNASFCEAFNAAMTADQAKIDQYCNASRNTASYCQKARTAIAALPAAGAGTAAAPATSMLDAGSGCSEANMQSITGSDFGTLQRQLGFDQSADSYWMYMATMAQHACGQYRDIQQVLRVVGVCEAPSGQVGTCTGEVERLGTCARDAFNQGSVDDFKRKIAEIDNTLCKQTPGTTTYTCVDGRSPFQIRNDIAAGNLTGLERVVTRLCPSQGTAFNSCRAANPVRSTTVVNPENIRQHLNQNNRMMATQAIDALVAGTSPSSSQQGGFFDSFGITTSEFKSLFCATDASAFVAAKTAAIRSRPSAGNAMRERMRNCMETAVTPDATRADGNREARSNYSARSCTMQEITGVIPAQAQGYLYYEKSTGLCRKASEIVSGSTVPTGQVIVPCRGSDIVTSSVRASQQFVRLDHAVTGGSDVQPVYACLDNIISGGADKLDIYRSSCSTADSSGDGADSSVAN